MKISSIAACSYLLFQHVARRDVDVQFRYPKVIWRLSAEIPRGAKQSRMSSLAIWRRRSGQKRAILAEL
jgi:hypothetical protein